MAFTLHWSNHSFGDAVDATRKGKERRINDVYDRLQSLDPILSIQRDVLFPRAAANFDYESTDSATMGCVGHGIDNDFPLKQKSKCCTPLVFMRDGKNSNANAAAEDLCARPVLNWEKYCVELKASTGRHRKRKKTVKRDEESCEEKEDKKETCKTAEKFVNIPKFRVEGTWNYKFTNKGACDWVPGNQRKGRIKLAVGHGDKLRLITLDINKGIKGIAYQAVKIEEELFDSESERRENDTSFDCIYQISSMKADQVIAARRDSTIDLYDAESSPRKLETIKPGGYSKVYVGKNDTSFLTFDVNPERPNEIATLDSSMTLQFHDFVAEKSTRPVLLGPMLDIKNRSQQRSDSIRKFTINKATGISYAVNPALLYIHHDSRVYLYDRRKPLYPSWNSQKCYELMDLRSNVEILSISDHSNGSYGSSDMRPEYISCVQRSCNTNYYYVGTSSRIFTMDWRVPRNPVVRASHGMKGAMSYMDVVLDRGKEIIVGGSQRGHEIFSMVLDYKHEECRTRAGCAAVNPILKSYPRHLCDPSSIVEEAQAQDYWSYPQYRVKARIEAWCSGLSAAVIPLSERLLRATDLSPICVASTNTFGDVFYQEWFPPGALESFAGGDTSSQMQLDLLEHCADLRPMLGANDLNEDTPDPVDCSIVVEETGNLTKKFVTVRSDPFTPMSSCIPKSSGKLEFLCDDMRSYKGPLIDKFVSVWESGRPHPAAAPVRSFDDSIETESRNLESELMPQSVTGTIPSDVQIKEEVSEPDYSSDSDIEEIPVEPKRLDVAAASVVSDNEDYVESDVFSQSLSQTVYHQFNEGYGMDTLELSCSNYDDYSYSVPAYPVTSQPNIPSSQPVSNVSRNASQSQTTIPSTSSQSQSQSKNIPRRRAGFL